MAEKTVAKMAVKNNNGSPVLMELTREEAEIIRQFRGAGPFNKRAFPRMAKDILNSALDKRLIAAGATLDTPPEEMTEILIKLADEYLAA